MKIFTTLAKTRNCSLLLQKIIQFLKPILVGECVVLAIVHQDSVEVEDCYRRP